METRKSLLLVLFCFALLSRTTSASGKNMKQSLSLRSSQGFKRRTSKVQGWTQKENENTDSWEWVGKQWNASSGKYDQVKWDESTGTVVIVHPESPANTPTADPSKSPSQSPIAHPSQSPSKSPTAHPSQSPSKSPTAQPSVSPTNIPSTTPTDAPSQFPSRSPSKRPTMNPTKSSQPSASPSEEVIFEINIPEVFILTVTPGTEGTYSLNQNLMKTVIYTIISNEFESKLPHFFNVEIKYRANEATDISFTNEATVISFTNQATIKFSVLCRVSSTENSPSSQALRELAIFAFKETDVPYVGPLLQGTIEEEPLISYAFQSGDMQTSGNYQVNTVNASTAIVNGALLTAVASAIAVISTLTALGLIVAQRRKFASEEDNPNTPTKAADENSPKALRKIRSPFTMSSPVDGTRKYFNRLDDESVSLKGQSTGYLNPEISVVNSSFSRDEESSLEAPSMAGLSSICELSKNEESMKSLDGMESCANMSALDEVRLGRVLNLDESTVGENSCTADSESGSKIERKTTFARLWYGSKKKKNQSSPGSARGNRLAPPKNDSPTKKPRSPVSNNDAEVEDSDVDSLIAKKDSDDNSLLGNQSDKGSYYNQNDESRNLFYSMLGDRSVNSLESDSVDFNEMYKIDASSHDEYSSMGGASSMMSSSVIATVAGEDEDDN